MALALLFAICGGAPGAIAAPKKDDLESVERQIERERGRQKSLEARSRKLVIEAAALRRDLIATARAAQEKETILTGLEKQLSTLVGEAESREAALAIQRRRLAGTLGALGRLSRNVPRALLFFPGDPTDMVRSAMLLRIAVPRLGARATTLSGEIEALSLVKKDIAGKLLKMRRTSGSLDEERTRLRTLLRRKNALRRETEAAYRKNAQRMRDLAAKARNIRELMARLRIGPEESPPPSVAALPPAASTGRPSDNTVPSSPPLSGGPPGGLRIFPEQGPVTRPVAGRLVGRYGEATDFGNVARGIRLETRADAQVVAPFDGKVVFAGPFRTFGQILIIEHRGGYHTLLAGMAQIDAVVGQWLLAGEPLGAMDTRRNENPVLYVELRRNGQPVNPLPWIAATDQKVRG